jgi:hypothetical protein
LPPLLQAHYGQKQATPSLRERKDLMLGCGTAVAVEIVCFAKLAPVTVAVFEKGHAD